MPRVFADTSYWVALLMARDKHHQSALEASGHYTAAQIVTSEMVLTEFLNGVSGYGA